MSAHSISLHIFEVLATQHEPMLMSYLVSLVGDYALAEDIPAKPGTGLTWDTSNLGLGVLGVSGGPAITNFNVSGSAITLQGAFGPAGGQFALLATTNVAMPVQWTPIATNLFDGSGNFEFTTNIVGSPQLYFMLRVP